MPDIAEEPKMTLLESVDEKRAEIERQAIFAMARQFAATFKPKRIGVLSLNRFVTVDLAPIDGMVAIRVEGTPIAKADPSETGIPLEVVCNTIRVIGALES
jgi:hypothetical protein